jgi:hypothetical protein
MSRRSFKQPNLAKVGRLVARVSGWLACIQSAAA